MVSVHNEQDIERQLRKIQRQDLDLQRQLHLAGLGIVLDCSQQLSQTRSAIGQARLETQSSDANIQSLIKTVEAHNSAHSSGLGQLKSAHEETASRILEEQTATRNAVDDHASTITPHLELLHLQGKTVHDEVSGVRETTTLMWSELKSLRDELLCLITQGTPTISPQSQEIAGRLTNNQNVELNHQIRRTLLETPQAIQQATDTWSTNSNASFFGSRSCSCIRRTEKWSTYKGIFGVRHTSLENHEALCHLRTIDSQSWKYSLSIQLLPFLKKTVELTFRATYQGGELAMAPPLKIWNTVKRSESPIFQLFDDFADICGTSHSEFRVKLINLRTSNQVNHYWDTHVVENQLSFMCQRIMELTTTDACPWRTRDQHGNTLWHVG